MSPTIRASSASWRPVVAGGLIAGTLDIGAASLINSVSPTLILHYIASGALGSRAFNLGAAATALGLVLQWLMSILIAAIYFWVTSRWRSLRTHWPRGGLSAGVVIFLVMNFLVMPLSAAPITYREILHDFRPAKYAADLLAMLIFGLIVAYCAHRLSDEPAGSGSESAGELPGSAG